jgi:hypothetical protein
MEGKTPIFKPQQTNGDILSPLFKGYYKELMFCGVVIPCNLPSMKKANI